MRLTNAEIGYLRSLRLKKVRSQEKKFLLEGWRALRECLQQRELIEFVIVSPATRERHADELAELTEMGISLREASEQQIRKLTETVEPQEVLAVVIQQTRSLEQVLRPEARLLLALDAVADPGNLGTILRTADWFAVEGVLLGLGTVDLHNEKVVRSSVGSLLHLPITEQVDLSLALQQAKDLGFRLLAAAGEGASSYVDVRLDSPTLLILGSEARGLSAEIQELADATISIPRQGLGESLNVAIACGILLAHLRAG